MQGCHHFRSLLSMSMPIITIYVGDYINGNDYGCIGREKIRQNFYSQAFYIGIRCNVSTNHLMNSISIHHPLKSIYRLMKNLRVPQICLKDYNGYITMVEDHSDGPSGCCARKYFCFPDNRYAAYDQMNVCSCCNRWSFSSSICLPNLSIESSASWRSLKTLWKSCQMAVLLLSWLPARLIVRWLLSLQICSSSGEAIAVILSRQRAPGFPLTFCLCCCALGTSWAPGRRWWWCCIVSRFLTSIPSWIVLRSWLRLG